MPVHVLEGIPVGLAFLLKWRCSALQSRLDCQGIQKKNVYWSCICSRMYLCGLAYLVCVLGHFKKESCLFIDIAFGLGCSCLTPHACFDYRGIAHTQKKGFPIDLAFGSRCSCSTLHSWFEWCDVSKRNGHPIGLAFVLRCRCSTLHCWWYCRAISKIITPIGLACVLKCSCSIFQSWFGCWGIFRREKMPSYRSCICIEM